MCVCVKYLEYFCARCCRLSVRRIDDNNTNNNNNNENKRNTRRKKKKMPTP